MTESKQKQSKLTLGNKSKLTLNNAKSTKSTTSKKTKTGVVVRRRSKSKANATATAKEQEKKLQLLRKANQDSAGHEQTAKARAESVARREEETKKAKAKTNELLRLKEINKKEKTKEQESGDSKTNQEPIPTTNVSNNKENRPDTTNNKDRHNGDHKNGNNRQNNADHNRNQSKDRDSKGDRDDRHNNNGNRNKNGGGYNNNRNQGNDRNNNNDRNNGDRNKNGGGYNNNRNQGNDRNNQNDRNNGDRNKNGGGYNNNRNQGNDRNNQNSGGYNNNRNQGNYSSDNKYGFDNVPSSPHKEEATRKTFTPRTPNKDRDKKKPTEKAPTSYSNRRQGSHISIQNLSFEDGERKRSQAAMNRARKKNKRKQQQNVETVKIYHEVAIPDFITVAELAKRMHERTADVVKKLMLMGTMATANQSIDSDTAELIVEDFGHKIKRVSESSVLDGIKRAVVKDESAPPRPPIVTIMGHVDHGKTSLLDALRQTDVVAKEAGGITQHIGAYQITLENQRHITFIDTPGHEAFSSMRARGASLTDIVILVVAANDGIMPQTIEAIHHAKAANVPLIVAINKIDLQDTDIAKVKQELLQHEVILEDYQGDTQCVEISAKSRINLEGLTDAIILQSEILELKASQTDSAQAIVVESKIDKGRGPVATVIVQHGTLSVGDIVVAGESWGKVRALVNDHGVRIKHALPSTPVEVMGLDKAPTAGEELDQVKSEQEARNIIQYRLSQAISKREAERAKSSSLESLMAKMKAGDIKELPVVIKGDVQGSVEALVTSLLKLSNDEIKVRILHSAVGAINESDITLANASNAVVVGFNVRANPQARNVARREKIDIRYHSIIYNVIDEITHILSGMLDPVYEEEFIGYATIREIFTFSKKRIAGCIVTEGFVKRGSKVRLLRDNIVIHEGKLDTLRRFKDDVKEVKEGYECGMNFETYNDIQEGDVIECFDIKEVKQTLSSQSQS